MDRCISIAEDRCESLHIQIYLMGLHVFSKIISKFRSKVYWFNGGTEDVKNMPEVLYHIPLTIEKFRTLWMES